MLTIIIVLFLSTFTQDKKGLKIVFKVSVCVASSNHQWLDFVEKTRLWRMAIKKHGFLQLRCNSLLYLCMHGMNWFQSLNKPSLPLFFPLIRVQDCWASSHHCPLSCQLGRCQKKRKKRKMQQNVHVAPFLLWYFQQTGMFNSKLTFYQVYFYLYLDII